MRDFIDLVESFEGINDKWFKHGSFKTFKLGNPISFETAHKPGTIETLEGPRDYERGHKIITGPQGEQYPVPPESFYDKYDDNGDGTATPKKIIKYAKLADHDGVIHSNWGDLTYSKGEHYIVRHGTDEYGPVQKDIFFQTYNTDEVK